MGEMKILPSPIRPVWAAFLDRFDGLFDQRVFNDQINFYLGQEINDIFRAPIEFGVTLFGVRIPWPQ